MNNPNNISLQIEDHSKNFDFIRLLLASFVIISHSFPLSGEKEILNVLTNNQLEFGGLSVNLFFVLSGYFIFISVQKSKSFKNFVWKRILRLYPALIILMLFTLIILPFLYIGENIFLEKSFWTYAPNTLTLYHISYSVNGIFQNNPFKNIINGSLWSLSYEFTMYLTISTLFFIKNRKFSISVILIVFLSSYLFSQFNPIFLNKFFKILYLDTNQFYRLTSFFFAGSLLTFIDLEKFNKLSIRILLFVILIISVFFNFYHFLSPLILIIQIGLLSTPILTNISKRIGDISYGVYIYGFIIQQSLMNYFNFNPYYLMFYSLIITFVFAYLSWHYVEKKMIKYKNIIK
jgi:peptidoglycan/LPS O-acetylase OafA/YrhL